MSLKARQSYGRVRTKMEATVKWALTTGLVLFLGGLELGSILVTNIEYLVLRLGKALVGGGTQYQQNKGEKKVVAQSP